MLASSFLSLGLLTSHRPNGNRAAQSKLAPVVGSREGGAGSDILENLGALEGRKEEAPPASLQVVGLAVVSPDGWQVQADDVDDEKSRQARKIEVAIRLVDDRRKGDEKLNRVSDYCARDGALLERTGEVRHRQESLDYSHFRGSGLVWC